MTPDGVVTPSDLLSLSKNSERNFLKENSKMNQNFLIIERKTD
jgi:hypothetical protein